MPENSRAAIRAGFELNVWMVETDLQFSADKKIVINHDATRNGYTIANEDYYGTLDQIQLSNGESLPLLEDILDIMEEYDNDVKFLLEIKNANAIEPAVDMVFERGLEDRCGWTSFSGVTNRKIISLYGEHGKVPFVNLSGNWASPDYDSLESDCTKALGLYTSVNLNSIAEGLAKGFELNIWTVDTTEQMKLYMKHDITSITTNYSRRLIELVEDLRKQQGK